MSTVATVRSGSRARNHPARPRIGATDDHDVLAHPHRIGVRDADLAAIGAEIALDVDPALGDRHRQRAAQDDAPIGIGDRIEPVELDSQHTGRSHAHKREAARHAKRSGNPGEARTLDRRLRSGKADRDLAVAQHQILGRHREAQRAPLEPPTDLRRRGGAA